ncbi:MAG: arylamine N-acetyltransferase family protein [Flavobacteriales bacterium]
MEEVQTLGIDELNTLIKQHVHSIPFENLDIMNKTGLSLDLTDLAQKVLFQKRGGFCYELNLLFAAFLTSLGYEVHLISGRVNNGKGDFGEEHDHLCLKVELDQPYLVDVGFGRMAECAVPLPLENVNTTVDDGKHTYRIVSFDNNYKIQLFQGPNKWRDLYLFSSDIKTIDQFEDMFKYHQTHHNSPFTQTLIVSKPTPQGRISISDKRLIISHRESKSIYTLESKEALEKALFDYFNIQL